jgi:hypothetical protein
MGYHKLVLWVGIGHGTLILGITFIPSAMEDGD